MRTALFARIDLWVNVVALVVQGVATGWVLTALGLAVALCVLPLLTAGGFIGLGLAPGLATLVAVQIARRGIQYGLERPSREVLFTVVSSEESTRRRRSSTPSSSAAGTRAAIWAYDAVRSISPPAIAVTAAMLVVCAGWVGVALFAARRHAALARRGHL